MYNLDEEEYRSRNFILSIEHGKIPSYCLWEISNDNSESNDEKIQWWSSFLGSKYIIVKLISKYWIKLLSQNNI